jgi:hypothetical protein
MSQEVVVEVITKVLMDNGFRDQLFADPETALTSYDLTEQERKALSSMEREKFDAFASDVEQRISKSGLGFGALRGDSGFSGSIRHFLNPQPEPP